MKMVVMIQSAFTHTESTHKTDHHHNKYAFFFSLNKSLPLLLLLLLLLLVHFCRANRTRHQGTSTHVGHRQNTPFSIASLKNMHYTHTSTHNSTNAHSYSQRRTPNRLTAITLGLKTLFHPATAPPTPDGEGTGWCKRRETTRRGVYGHCSTQAAPALARLHRNTLANGNPDAYSHAAPSCAGARKTACNINLVLPF